MSCSKLAANGSTLFEELDRLGRPNGKILVKRGRLMCFDYNNNVVSWSYGIVPPEASFAGYRRDYRASSDFLVDFDLPPGNRVSDFDLKGKVSAVSSVTGKKTVVCTKTNPVGRQKGHVSPYVFQRHNDEELKDANQMSNMCFQVTHVNCPVLSDIDNRTLTLATVFKTHHFEGTIFTSAPITMHGEKVKMGEPHMIFKLNVFEINPTTFRYECFIVPNSEDCDRNPFCYMKTLDELISAKKIEFLSAIDRANLFSFDQSVIPIVSSMTRHEPIPPPQALPAHPPTPDTKKRRWQNKTENLPPAKTKK